MMWETSTHSMTAVSGGSVLYLQFVPYCQTSEYHMQCIDFEDGEDKTVGHHSEEIKC